MDSRGTCQIDAARCGDEFTRPEAYAQSARFHYPVAGYPCKDCAMASVLVVFLAYMTQSEPATVTSAGGVLTRLLHQRASDFVLTEIPRENGLDVFIVESKDGTVHVAGSTGVA